MAESQDISTPDDCTSFLEFADRLNVPINQGYLNHISEQIKTRNQFDLNALDVGVKDSKTHKKFNERRIQNALWRAWWRQRSTRFNSGQKKLPLEEEQLETVGESMNHLWGRDISDIPTEYSIPDDLEAHELPVIGTYVDPYIIPGFSYRVRFCGSKQKDNLFDGKALRLDRIGAGYGKRLTFEDHDILDCDNFFWSDSNPEGGFAFSVNVLNEGQRFKVFDSLNREVGEVKVLEVDSRSQVVSSRVANSETILDVRVNFRCNIVFLGSDNVPESRRGKTSELSVTGIAKMIKVPQTKSAVLVEVNEVTIPEVGERIFDIGGDRYPLLFNNESLDFVAFFHEPHYVLAEAAPIEAVREEPGRAPALDVVDDTQPRQYVYMIRDLGARRQPAVVLTIGGGLIFLALCYLLHRRDKILEENLSGSKAVATA